MYFFLILFLFLVVGKKKEPQKKCPYKVLELSKKASLAEIKKSYKKKALEWHPDKVKEEDKEEATLKFREIAEAYEILSDSEKRQKYDKHGHAGLNPQSGGDDFHFQNANDIFEAFFGGGGGFHFGHGGFQQQQREQHLYEETDIQELALQQFRELKDNAVSSPFVVKFYKNRCEFCENIKTDIIKLHQSFSDIFDVYVVNCDRKGAKICEDQKIRNVPRLVLYSTSVDLEDRTKLEFLKKEYVPKEGPRVYVAMANWLASVTPNFCHELKNPTVSEIRAWLGKHGGRGGRAPVVFFTEKASLSTLLKSLSLLYRMRLNILAVTKAENPEIRRIFEITDFPYLVYFGDPIILEDRKTLEVSKKASLENLSQFFRAVHAYHRSKSLTAYRGQYTSGHFDAGLCSKEDKNFCLFYFTALGVDKQPPHSTNLEALGQHFLNDPVKVFYVPREGLLRQFQNVFLEAAEEAKQQKYVLDLVVVLFRPKRGKYAYLSLEQPDLVKITSFVDNAIHSGHQLPNKAGSLELKFSREEL